MWLNHENDKLLAARSNQSGKTHEGAFLSVEVNEEMWSNANKKPIKFTAPSIDKSESFSHPPSPLLDINNEYSKREILM